MLLFCQHRVALEEKVSPSSRAELLSHPAPQQLLLLATSLQSWCSESHSWTALGMKLTTPLGSNQEPRSCRS